jgi:hypothetical protein
MIRDAFIVAPESSGGNVPWTVRGREEGLSSAPTGLARLLGKTHGLRRGLHSFAASRLAWNEAGSLIIASMGGYFAKK